MEGSSRASLALAVAACTIPAAFLVNKIVPESYMDEIFHIPQGRQYCNLNFRDWDPMITTFPGLYFFSVALKFLLYPVGSLVDPCGASTLRAVNLILSCVCAVLFREILLELDPKKRSGAAFSKALVLSLYPLQWTIASLYYTDIGSTTALMAMYLACLKDRYWLSGLFSCAAILCRQTNAVWTAFVMVVGVTRMLRQQNLKVDKRSMEEIMIKEELVRLKMVNGVSGVNGIVNGTIIGNGSINYSTIRKRNTALNLDEQEHHGIAKFRAPAKDSRGVLEDIWFLASNAWTRKVEIVWNFFPMLLSLAGFVAFVKYNGSIVLGDKTSHQASHHFAQLLYGGAVTTLGLAPFHFTKEKVASFTNFCRKSPVKAIGLVASSFALVTSFVHFFSVQHKYLLADDRHAVYYIWKYIIMPYKYWLIPSYVYAWCSIFHSLAASRSVEWTWVLAFCGAAVASLVPSPLMELRYYTVVFYLTALHILSGPQISKSKLITTAALFVAIDMVGMYMFLYLPWLRENDPGNHRYIW